MTQQQIALVQQSFAAIRSDADLIAMRFYARLFFLDSSLRALFPHNMTEQGRKLITMLAFVVQGLDSPGELLPHVVRLGERHRGYGVEDRHYATVGDALLWTLEKELGNEFTVEVRDAWTAAFTLLASTMTEPSAETMAA